jgi:hypothetical protein
VSPGAQAGFLIGDFEIQKLPPSRRDEGFLDHALTTFPIFACIVFYYNAEPVPS